jgi:adenine/guanine phosphoribosyltransferase-like PRPP-binding protein
MRHVLDDQRPDALIGIRTGGLVVAASMAKAAGGDMPVLAVTCRRPSSRHKPTSSRVRHLVAQLPRPLLDQLRLVEHAILTRKPPATPPGDYHFDENELSDLDAWLASSGQRPSVLIVDDAVDSGTTLSVVLGAIRKRAPRTATIRSAAITVTTERPLALPDYALYHRQLCRFPWSLDALTDSQCSS